MVDGNKTKATRFDTEMFNRVSEALNKNNIPFTRIEVTVTENEIL